MIEKIKNLYQHPRAKDFRDVRVFGLIVFGIIVLLVSWSGVRVIETNYSLQQQIARLEEENVLKELQNRNIKLENEYYKTDQYLELQARKNFGKAAPGETLVLVPEEIALNYVKKSQNKDGINEKQDPNKPFYQKNFEAWMQFIFNKNSDSGI